MRIHNERLRSSFVRGILLAAWLALSVNSARAQAPPQAPKAPTAGAPVVGTSDWDQWKSNCALAHDFRQKLIRCATSTFTSRPFHFVAQSIVPGSGVGGGGRYSRDLNEKGGAQDQLQGTAVITIRKFWLAELKFSTSRSIDKDWNKSQESLRINIYARNRSLPVMTFYGLGPNTNVNNSVKFGQDRKSVV